MKSNLFMRAWSIAALALLFTFAASSVNAQEEGVPVVVDEVIAQVNDQVITLSMLKREMNEAERALVERGNMTAEQAKEEVARNQPKVIANLINEQLIMQKAKEIPRLAEDVEAEVNREMLRVAKAQGINTMEALEAALAEQKISIADIRQTLRAQITRQAVLQNELYRKIYFSLTNDELKKYFEANKSKFAKPESVELSEIFLSLAGKPEAEVKAKAQQLVAQLRGGADFAALAAANSERMQDGKLVAQETKGKVGRYQVTDLRPEIAEVIKNVAKGGVTDPLRLDEGYQIIRVDDRTPATEPVFNEEQVRGALTQERAEKEQENYIGGLRKDAFIKVAEPYKETVEPLLKVEIQTPAKNDKSAESSTATNKKSKKQ